jgi:predicted HicB family RNase H-like nuclease
MSQYALRIPDSLAGYAKKLAREDNVSLNQFIVMALAEKVSA